MYVAIQRGLNRTKKRVIGNVMKFNKEKCDVVDLERNNPRQQDSLMSNQLESSLSEKALVVMVDKLAKSPQQAVVVKASSTLDHTEQGIDRPLRKVIPPLLSTEEEASKCFVETWTPYETWTYRSKGPQ